MSCRGTGDAGRKADSKEREYIFKIYIQQSKTQEMSVKRKLSCREGEMKGTELQHYPGKRKELGKTKI